LLKRKEVEEKLTRIEREGMLNIQPLDVKSLPHSSSSSKCAKRKVYNEKIQFALMIIQNIDTIGTSSIEFWHKSKRHWQARE